MTDVPPEFAATLARMRAERDPRLDAVLHAARAAGWTQPPLARALGMHQASVSYRLLTSRGIVGPPPDDVVIPPAPPRTRVPGKGKRSPDGVLTDDLVREIRELNAVARQVNGRVRADDPRRRASERLAEILADVWLTRGVSPSAIERLTGIKQGTIRMRLIRHGYIKRPPSMWRARYRGTATGETES